MGRKRKPYHSVALAAELRRLRVERDLDQCHVARVTGISRSMLRGFEAGKWSLSLAELTALAGLYCVDVDRLAEIGTPKAATEPEALP